MKKTLIVATVLAAAGLIRADGITPLVGTNTVGFAIVTNIANQANTIITVPFEACLSNGVSGYLSDLVSTNGLTSDPGNAAHADQLVVLTTNTDGSLIYYYYWLQTGLGWTNVPTEVLMPEGTSNTVVNPPAANAFRIARGLGFWLKRAYPNTGSTVFVKGQVSTNKQSTVIASGLNLIGFANPSALTLNDSGISWAGANGGTGNTVTSDKILIVGANGSLTPYWFFINPTGPSVGSFAACDHKWIDANYVVATNVSISAGQGFWYVSRGATNFTFLPGL
jgi:hypothetical protein